MSIIAKSKSSYRSRFVNFERNFLEPDIPLQCLGNGEVGGKAEGLAYIRNILFEELKPELFPDITVEIPPMVVLCTDIFDNFMEQNHLYDLVYSNIPLQRIAYSFQKAELPFEVLGDLRAIVEKVHTPLAVRSSSLLEDTIDMPFAGIYATKMIPNNQYDPDVRFRQLVEAIKFVYASTFADSAKNYRKAIGHSDQNEKMAIVIQNLVGKRYHSHFYPEMAGVARSYN
jgi:phosphoenolpyruvate synthase/pyruvate phosphate dikinase